VSELCVTDIYSEFLTPKRFTFRGDKQTHALMTI